MKDISGKIGKDNQSPLESSLVRVKRLIISYHDKRNKFPPIDWLIDKMGLSRENIIHFLRIWEHRGFIYRNVAQYYLASSLPAPDEKPKEPARISLDFLKHIPIKMDSLTVLKIILAVIGSGAVYMSVYYSHMYLLEFLPSVLALLSAVIMVLFAVSAFEMIMLFHHRQKRWLIVLFAVLWVVVTAYSMISTVAGQYNVRMERVIQQRQLVESENATRRAAELKYASVEEREADIRNRLYRYTIELSNVNETIGIYTAELITARPNTYNSLRWQRTVLRKDIKALDKELTVLLNEKAIFLVDNSGAIGYDGQLTITKDFYQWMASLSGWKPAAIQFWMSMFLAVFFDIMAPVSFAVVMFLKGD